MSITVAFDPQHHIWEAAAQDDNRPALACVLIDPSGVLVAADGFLLGIVKADVGGLTEPVLVNAEAFKAAVDAVSHPLNALAKVTLVTEKRICFVNTETHTRVWPFSKGAFPNWKQLVPDFSKLKDGLPTGGYDPRLAEKAMAVTGGFGVTGGGLGPSLPFVIVSTQETALVVLMPMFYGTGVVTEHLRKTYHNLGLMATAVRSGKAG